MKEFLKYIALIAVIITTCMVVLEVVYTYTYEHSIPRNKTQYLLKLKDEKIDYVFFGSSRVENHIVTKLIEEKTGKKAANIGIQGASLDDVALLIKILVNNNIATEKIFIQVDYLYNIENPSTIVGTESLPFICSNEVIKEHRKENSDFIFNYYIPFYRYGKNDFKIGFREFFNSTIGKKSRVEFTNGFEPNNGNFSNGGASLPETILVKNNNIEEITAFCKNNNIQVVYFCAPFCSEMGNKEFMELLKHKIPDLVDFSQVITSDSYFRDCLHLNEQGAHLFTEKLIDSCLVKK